MNKPDPHSDENTSVMQQLWFVVKSIKKKLTFTPGHRLMSPNGAQFERLKRLIQQLSDKQRKKHSNPSQYAHY